MRQATLGPATVDQFIALFVASVRARAALLSSYGAQEASAACERTAGDLEEAFRSWWTAGLSVTEASAASGYSPESPARAGAGRAPSRPSRARRAR